LQQKNQQIKTIMERMWAISSVGASLDFDASPRAVAGCSAFSVTQRCFSMWTGEGFARESGILHTPRLGTAAKGILFFW